MSKPDDILTAVYKKDLQALRKFTPADLNLRDPDGRTPLMHAVLAEDADPAVVKFLIERGADVNATDNDQEWTALHFAASDQKEEIVRVLLEAGAKVDAVDVFGNTPLWRAVMTASSNLGVVKVLLKYEADPSKKNNHGVAPIDLTREIGRADIVALIEGRGS